MMSSVISIGRLSRASCRASAQPPPLSGSDNGLCRRPCRDRKREGAAQAGLAHDRDRPAVHLDELAHDAQAEARTTVPPGAAAVTLNELLEDDSLGLGGNADAGVLDGDPHHAARRLRLDLDVAALGEFHGVG
jgi:hypothetical protein